LPARRSGGAALPGQARMPGPARRVRLAAWGDRGREQEEPGRARQELVRAQAPVRVQRLQRPGAQCSPTATRCRVKIGATTPRSASRRRGQRRTPPGAPRPTGAPTSSPCRGERRPGTTPRRSPGDPTPRRGPAHTAWLRPSVSCTDPSGSRARPDQVLLLLKVRRQRPPRIRKGS
jgi:hypothetical protein